MIGSGQPLKMYEVGPPGLDLGGKLPHAEEVIGSCRSVSGVTPGCAACG